MNECISIAYCLGLKLKSWSWSWSSESWSWLSESWLHCITVDL